MGLVLLDWSNPTVLVCLISLVAFLAVPSDRKERMAFEIKMDWLGLLTTVPRLVLVVFAITSSSHASKGCRTPYIYLTFVLGVLFLCVAVFVEGWIAEMPLLPLDLFEVKYMKPLVIVLFFSYGVFGIYLFYASF